MGAAILDLVSVARSRHVWELQSVNWQLIDASSFVCIL